MRRPPWHSHASLPAVALLALLAGPAAAKSGGSSTDAYKRHIVGVACGDSGQLLVAKAGNASITLQECEGICMGTGTGGYRMCWFYNWTPETGNPSIGKCDLSRSGNCPSVDHYSVSTFKTGERDGDYNPSDAESAKIKDSFMRAVHACDTTSCAMATHCNVSPTCEHAHTSHCPQSQDVHSPLHANFPRGFTLNVNAEPVCAACPDGMISNNSFVCQKDSTPSPSSTPVSANPSIQSFFENYAKGFAGINQQDYGSHVDQNIQIYWHGNKDIIPRGTTMMDMDLASKTRKQKPWVGKDGYKNFVDLTGGAMIVKYQAADAKNGFKDFDFDETLKVTSVHKGGKAEQASVVVSEAYVYEVDGTVVAKHDGNNQYARQDVFALIARITDDFVIVLRFENKETMSNDSTIKTVVSEYLPCFEGKGGKTPDELTWCPVRLAETITFGLSNKKLINQPVLAIARLNTQDKVTQVDFWTDSLMYAKTVCSGQLQCGGEGRAGSGRRLTEREEWLENGGEYDAGGWPGLEQALAMQKAGTRRQLADSIEMDNYNNVYRFVNRLLGTPGRPANRHDAFNSYADNNVSLRFNGDQNSKLIGRPASQGPGGYLADTYDGIDSALEFYESLNEYAYLINPPPHKIHFPCSANTCVVQYEFKGYFKLNGCTSADANAGHSWCEPIADYANVIFTFNPANNKIMMIDYFVDSTLWAQQFCGEDSEGDERSLTCACGRHSKSIAVDVASAHNASKATNLGKMAKCECKPGYYLDTYRKVCAKCAQGQVKELYGNRKDLCHVCGDTTAGTPTPDAQGLIPNPTGSKCISQLPTCRPENVDATCCTTDGYFKRTCGSSGKCRNVIDGTDQVKDSQGSCKECMRDTYEIVLDLDFHDTEFTCLDFCAFAEKQSTQHPMYSNRFQVSVAAVNDVYPDAVRLTNPSCGTRRRLQGGTPTNPHACDFGGKFPVTFKVTGDPSYLETKARDIDAYQKLIDLWAGINASVTGITSIYIGESEVDTEDCNSSDNKTLEITFVIDSLTQAQFDAHTNEIGKVIAKNNDINVHSKQIKFIGETPQGPNLKMDVRIEGLTNERVTAIQGHLNMSAANPEVNSPDYIREIESEVQKFIRVDPNSRTPTPSPSTGPSSHVTLPPATAPDVPETAPPTMQPTLEPQNAGGTVITVIVILGLLIGGGIAMYSWYANGTICFTSKDCCAEFPCRKDGTGYGGLIDAPTPTTNPTPRVAGQAGGYRAPTSSRTSRETAAQLRDARPSLDADKAIGNKKIMENDWHEL